MRGGTRIDAPTFGSMMEKTDKTKRASPISIRIPTDELAEFRRRVEASGLPVNAYVIRAILNAPIPRGTRRPVVEKQMLAQLLGRSAAIRDALDNASRITGAGAADAIKAACEELTVIRAALMKMMEREP